MNYRNLLQEAHDALDEGNATNGRCSCCGATGYDGDGIPHDDDCLVLRIRQALNPPRPVKVTTPEEVLRVIAEGRTSNAQRTAERYFREQEGHG